MSVIYSDKINIDKVVEEMIIFRNPKGDLLYWVELWNRNKSNKSHKYEIKFMLTTLFYLFRKIHAVLQDDNMAIQDFLEYLNKQNV